MLVFVSFTICSILRIRLFQHRLGDWLISFSAGWVANSFASAPVGCVSLVRAVSGLARRPFVSCWSQLARLTLLWLLALLWSRLL